MSLTAIKPHSNVIRGELVDDFEDMDDDLAFTSSLKGHEVPFF